MLPRPSRVLVTNPDRQLPCHFSKTVLRIPSTIEAEVFGTGVKMWLLSQGSKVKVTAPETLVQEMKQEIERMNGQY